MQVNLKTRNFGGNCDHIDSSFAVDWFNHSTDTDTDQDLSCNLMHYALDAWKVQKLAVLVTPTFLWS